MHRGYVFLTADPGEASRLRTHASQTTQFVNSAPAIRERYPFVTDRVLAMLHVRRAGFMNAMKLGQYLLDRVRENGVEVVSDEAVGLITDFYSTSPAGGRPSIGSRVAIAPTVYTVAVIQTTSRRPLRRPH